ncbi:MAG: hypothetical protein Q7V57_15060 [Actinomycetota bacterium]|nr:hypothetical protein [Actinomycetota bacterium]
MSARRGVALVALFALTTACVKVEQHAGGSTTTAAPGGTPVAGTGAAFALGVEYMELGLGGTYAATGVRWAKTRGEAFAWGQVEPAAPVGGVHAYDWSLTDRLIDEYQQAGITHIQSYLESKSPWGSASAHDVMPKPDLLADYAAFVGALVERYDGDGSSDMPGLVAPVQHWVIGSEWTGFWPSGSAEDYLRLLAAAAGAARAAYPEVQIGSIPFMLVDVFSGNAPSDAEVAARLKDPPPAFRNSTVGMLQILDRPDLFDYVDVHSLGDYTEIAPTFAWLRARMAERGYSKPIWIDDAFPVGFLANLRIVPDGGWPSIHPVTDATHDQVLALLVAVARGEEPAASEAVAWIRALAASEMVKKVATAVGEGAAGIEIGNLEDWMVDTGPVVREVTVNLIGAAGMFGMIDVTHPHGYGIDAVRAPGAARPAYLNLALLTALIGDGHFDSVEAVGGLTGARGYRFSRGGDVTWVLWNEAGLVLPGQPDPSVPFELTLAPGATHVVVTTVATTTLGPSTVEQAASTTGIVHLTLSTVPVIVRESA